MTPTTEPSKLEHDTLLRVHMDESFDLLRAIERLLIRGRPGDAQRFAAAISETVEAPAHGPWAARLAAYARSYFDLDVGRD